MFSLDLYELRFGELVFDARSRKTENRVFLCVHSQCLWFLTLRQHVGREVPGNHTFYSDVDVNACYD